MSQLSGQNGKAHTSPGGRAIALHRQGGQVGAGKRWRMVVLERRDRAAILEARTLAADPWPAALEAADRHGTRRVVVVAPGHATVARCAGVPAGPAEEMFAAVSLMAEAQLPESLPAHRRTGAVIPDSERPGLRTALMTGWTVEDVTSASSPKSVPETLDVTYTTPIAALAALRAGAGAALYADPAEGAISMVAGGDEKTLARVLVEDGSSGFWRSVAQVAAETAQAAGVAAPHISTSAAGPALRLDPRSISWLRSTIDELTDRQEWLNDYGIALGAALIATSPDPHLRPLAELRAAAPIIREPALTRAVGWLARPRNAWSVAAASALLMLLGPLALGAARLAIVNAKSRGMADTRQQGESARRQAMIRQLEASRWPMSKLLADVAGAVPVGVVAESVRLSEQGLSIQGTAESPELVSDLLDNLGETSLFPGLKPNRIESTGTGVEFDVSADVVNPYRPVKPAEDFAAKNLAARLYKDDKASNTTTPIGSRRASSSGNSGGNSFREGRRARDRAERNADRAAGETAPASGERAARPREGATRTAPPNPADAPKALTDEQINAMDESTATKEFVSRRVFSQKTGVDAATKSRLEDEVNRLKARRETLRSAPAPTAPTGAPAPTGSPAPTGAPAPAPPGEKKA